MAYSAVGATNVGSIKVYCDKDLYTNAIKWPEIKHWKDAKLNCIYLKKGELFGELEWDLLLYYYLKLQKILNFVYMLDKQ